MKPASAVKVELGPETGPAANNSLKRADVARQGKHRHASFYAVALIRNKV